MPSRDLTARVRAATGAPPPFRPEVVRAFSRLWAATVLRYLRRRFSGVGHGGAVDFVQRAGGSLNLNVHFHLAALDGVFRAARSDGVVFRQADPPTREELFGVLDDFRTRALRWLRRRGLLDEDGASAERSPCFDGYGALDACAQAAVQRGPFERREAGSGEAAPPEDDDLRFAARGPTRWSVESDGFSLHAGVSMTRLTGIPHAILCCGGEAPVEPTDGGVEDGGSETADVPLEAEAEGEGEDADADIEGDVSTAGSS